MTNGKKPEAKPTKGKTPMNAPLPDGMLGSKEMAKKLGLEPRKLRIILRASGHGSSGERYAWKEGDLPKLAAMVKKYEEEQK